MIENVIIIIRQVYKGRGEKESRLWVTGLPKKNSNRSPGRTKLTHIHTIHYNTGDLQYIHTWHINRWLIDFFGRWHTVLSLETVSGIKCPKLR